MNKNIKLTVKESAATDADFYNLFRPIAPSIDTIGKVAQVISAITEGVTIWFITQSEMAGSSKLLSILVSIISMILVISLLELGGRKFLQVLTRALVWKRLKNVWTISLFSILLFITLGIALLSFNLSTNGIHHAFTASTQVEQTMNTQAFKEDLRKAIAIIQQNAANDLEVLEVQHQHKVKDIKRKHQTIIDSKLSKAKSYDRKFAQGHKWAKSRADAERQNARKTKQTMALLLSKADNNFIASSKELIQEKKTAIATAQKQYQNEVQEAKTVFSAAHNKRKTTAGFWGTMFSFVVGFSVILAFICIISVEVYRRGAGIKVAYVEEEKSNPIWLIFWEGISSRLDHFFRSRAERFARMPAAHSKGKIGFNYSASTAAGAMKSHQKDK